MNQKFFFTCCMLYVVPALIFIPAELVCAAIHHVPSQFNTISKALDAAVSGDTVKVANGSYFEHISLKEGVTLQGGWNRDFSTRNISKGFNQAVCI